MATLRLLGFTGEIPRLVSRLLPDSASEESFNVRMDDGGLTPIRLPRKVHEFDAMPDTGYQTVYKHADEWLAWPGDVYAVPGPVAQDRLYVFGEGKPKVRIEGVVYDLAVSAPPDPLLATLSGTATSNLNSSRLYVYTNVTQFGEESEPSLMSNVLNWFPGEVVTLSGFDTAMTNNRTAAKQRIYRSQSASTGTQLFLIHERDATASDFVDTLSLEKIQEPLPSLNWNAPPNDLTGVISLPNGMMAGFVGKDVYFCEPYIPHAWPQMYSMTVDYNIVALAAYGSTIVVMTDGHPYLMSGSAPENMQSEKLELNLPCINARGVQDLGYSVLYPSHDGLVSVSSGSANVITSALLTRTDWQRYQPEAQVSGQFSGRYFTCYRYLDDQRNEYSGTMIFDLSGSQPFIIRTDITPAAFYYDISSGELYFLDGPDVFLWDAPGKPNAMLFNRSKEFVLPRPTNFGAILIEADSSLSREELQAIEQRQADIIASNQAMIEAGTLGGDINGCGFNECTVNGDLLQTVPTISRTVSVSIYADNEHVATVSKHGTMARLPSGFLARRWKVGVSSDIPISQITLATTGAELMGI